MEREKQLELALWQVKEAAWALYAQAGSRPGVPALVEKVTSEVNTTLRSLGFNPAILRK